MPKKKQRRIVDKLSPALMKKLRRSRALIAEELPQLIEKGQRLYDAMREPTTSGALRRATHSSKILLPELDARSDEEWIAADEAAAAGGDGQAVITVPASLLPEIRRLLAAHKTAS